MYFKVLIEMLSFYLTYHFLKNKRTKEDTSYTVSEMKININQIYSILLYV